jgi:hypothetical protein
MTVMVFLGLPLPGQAQCPPGNPLLVLAGTTWNFSAEGIFPFNYASSGAFTAAIGVDSKGNPKGLLTIRRSTISRGAGRLSEMDAGVFQILADCSGGTLTFFSPDVANAFDFWFFRDRTRIYFVGSNPGAPILGAASFVGTSPVTRSALTALLQQSFILPTPTRFAVFADLPPNDPRYASAQAISPFMHSQILCPGCRLSANFLPDTAPTRAEFAVLLVSLLLAGNKLELLSITDTNAVLSSVPDAGNSMLLPFLARPFIATAVKNGILTLEAGNNFQPTQPSSFADLITGLNAIQQQFGLPVIIPAQ